MVRFSDDQVMKATGGRRLRLSARASFEAICTDTRKLTPGCLFVALSGEHHDAHAFLSQAVAGGAAAAVVQAGRTLPATSPDFGLYEVADTLHALGALGRFHRMRFRFPIGAITGSNGKTTTKEMVGAILETRGPVLKTRGNLNNEIGVPQMLFELEPSQVAGVLELGMNHSGEIARLTEMVQPDAGLITVVQPAHLLGLGSVEGVAAAKGELFLGLRPGARAVVNLDDARVAALPLGRGAGRLTFGRAAQADVRLLEAAPNGRAGLLLTLRHEGKEHRVALGFVGLHNALNAAGAFALGVALGYPAEACVAGLAAARPYERRLNVVDAPGGVTVLDDCYNANPASMAAALETLAQLAASGRAIAVLGDMLELGPDEAKEHAALATRAGEVASKVAFFGPRSAKGAAALGPQRSAHFLEAPPLVAWLKSQLQAGDVVLVKGSRGMRLERVVEALTGVVKELH